MDLVNSYAVVRLFPVSTGINRYDWDFENDCFSVPRKYGD